MPPKEAPSVQDAATHDSTGPATSADSQAAPADATASTAASSSASPAATRGRGRGRGRAGRLLSQPKFTGRRSAADRQELERVEAEKRRAEQQARAKSDGKRGGRREDGGRGDGARGRGRGRGRGGFVGESDNSLSIASGPFSAGQSRGKGLFRSSAGGGGRFGSSGAAGSSSQSSPFAGGFNAPGRRGPPGNTNGMKQESFAGGSFKRDADGDVSMGIKSEGRIAEDGGYISSDEDEEDQVTGRLNVEELSMIDLTKDDEPADRFAPVRVARVAHKERVIGINADGATNKDGDIALDSNDAAGTSTSEKKHGKQKSKDVEIVMERQKFMSVYEDSSSDAEAEPHIKPDPDAPPPRPATPEPAPASSSPGTLPLEPLSSPEQNRKAKEKIKTSIPSGPVAKRPDYQTQEEINEWERRQHDLQLLRSELGVLSSRTVDQAGEAGEAGNAGASGDANADTRDNKAYLFQFPPVLPDLAPIQVKPEPDANETSAVEEADPDAMQVDEAKTRVVHAQQQLKLPSGLVGKLRIHASGRATLDWGGTSLCLGMGTDASFLQDILIAKLPDSKLGIKSEDSAQPSAASGGDEPGVAMSMGQVKGKFVVTPDWDEILGGAP